MTETGMLVAMAVSAILFSLGGMFWKPLRRYILPLFLVIMAIIANIIWYKALAMGICLIVALSLPYGSKTSYPTKLLTFIAIFASTLWLGFTIWQIISPITMLVMFKLSNWEPLANEFSWRVWEFVTGGLLGITVATLLK